MSEDLSALIAYQDVVIEQLTSDTQNALNVSPMSISGSNTTTGQQGQAGTMLEVYNLGGGSNNNLFRRVIGFHDLEPGRSSWEDSGAQSTLSSWNATPCHITTGSQNDRTLDESEEDRNKHNCAVYITNLPHRCDVRMLLSSIRNVGKISGSLVSPPTTRHTTAAAKIVFWDRPSTLRFLELSRSGGWTVGGLAPIARYNRVQAAARPPSPESRVIRVRGPADLLSEGYLRRVLSGHCTCELEGVEEAALPADETQIEFRFASFGGRAAAAAHRVCAGLRAGDPEFTAWMTGEELAMWARVRVDWAPDPCE